MRHYPEKAMFLNRTGITSVPGSAFYHDEGGQNILRFCFAKNDDVLEETCARIKNLNVR